MDLIRVYFQKYSYQDTAAFAVALSVPRAASGATHSGATHGKVRDKIVHECCCAGRSHGSVLAAKQPRLTRPHRHHQVLGRRFFAAKKRLQKQGLKTIGTKTCFARTHTHISFGTQRFRRDNLGCPSRSYMTQLLLHGHTWVSRRSRHSHASVLALNSCVVYDHTDSNCWVGISLQQESGCKGKGQKL